MGCSPWGRQESDTTERLHFHFLLSCIGEGNGDPLQCSCLENPRDGGAWWGAVYGVTQSRTRLKRLSSSKTSSRASRVVPVVKNPLANAGDMRDAGSIHGSGRFPWRIRGTIATDLYELYGLWPARLLYPWDSPWTWEHVSMDTFNR